MSRTSRTSPAAGPGEDDVHPPPDGEQPAVPPDEQPPGPDDAAPEEPPTTEEAAAEPPTDAEPDAGQAGEDGPPQSDRSATEPEPAEAAEPEPAEAAEPPAGTPPARRRGRDPLASALIGLLTLLLGFAFAVQVRNTGTDQVLAGAREEDLVRIIDELNAREDRLRAQITEQRAALSQLSSSDSQSSTALEEARKRAEAIGILNGTIAARGPGMEMTIRDPDDEVRVADVLDAIQELRGAGAETMQIDGVRVGVSTAVTGQPGSLMLDGHPIDAPYQFVVIGDGQAMETAMNIPGGVVQRIAGRGGSVTIHQSAAVVVDALRPLDEPQYASPRTGG